MNIAITSDNHIQQLADPRQSVTGLIGFIRENKTDVLCVLGDMGEGLRFGRPREYAMLLGSIDPTFFVLGNHDLWSSHGAGLTPPSAMTAALRNFGHGLPLETAWDDTVTIHSVGDCVFVGTMGFPDFAHPRLEGLRAFYDARSATVDHLFINLRDGWITHTDRMQQAFAVRLEKALATPCSQVVVLTHYPILEPQSRLVDDRGATVQVWPYFFNWTIGQMVLAAAGRHPDRRFWCFAGHAHEYCVGKLFQMSDNVFAFGLKTTYGTQDVFVFDPATTTTENAGRAKRLRQ
jgi:hypothetical protein